MSRFFGTDGIRGKVGRHPLVDEVVFALGRAVAVWLDLHDKSSSSRTLIIGKDTRSSCDGLIETLSRGAKTMGMRVVEVGVVPTPGLAYLTKELGAGIGAMISASHNLATENGIKLFSAV